jgi:hypothetical protein
MVCGRKKEGALWAPYEGLRGGETALVASAGTYDTQRFADVNSSAMQKSYAVQK